MNKPTFTPEQLDALRLPFVRNADKESVAALDGVDAAAAAITQFISENRGHIGGIAVVILAKPGSALVDSTESKAMDGITFARVLNQPMAMAMEHHLQDLAAVASRM